MNSDFLLGWIWGSSPGFCPYQDGCGVCTLFLLEVGSGVPGGWHSRFLLIQHDWFFCSLFFLLPLPIKMPGSPAKVCVGLLVSERCFYRVAECPWMDSILLIYDLPHSTLRTYHRMLGGCAQAWGPQTKEVFWCVCSVVYSDLLPVPLPLALSLLPRACVWTVAVRSFATRNLPRFAFLPFLACVWDLF